MDFYKNDFSWCADSESCGNVECFRHLSNLQQYSGEPYSCASCMGTEDCPYKVTREEKKEEDEEKYVLTPWGCLYGVMLDYGIDVSSIRGRVGEHIVEDFMEAMEKAGYVTKSEEE